ncbi:hypothetical protein ACWN56_05085 [Weissella viridescens]|uniref:XkdX family protein n=1 Tax=Weissella viridescens TaxID=1629 RepID=A0A380P8C0_WEIVI|nr:hypothetical protein [Weissella viridescens]SUP61446.1 Uncharacterised protein [Weissella viridescens]
MFDLYNNLYKYGLMKASDIKDMVIYLPAFGLTPLDYEKITGKSWTDEEAKTTEEAKAPTQS